MLHIKYIIHVHVWHTYRSVGSYDAHYGPARQGEAQIVHKHLHEYISILDSAYVVCIHVHKQDVSTDIYIIESIQIENYTYKYLAPEGLGHALGLDNHVAF